MNLRGDIMREISILGAGFSCIDIIRSDHKTEYGPGGTAANVMCILSLLGVQTSLLIPHYGDLYANYLLEELRRRKVNIISFKNSKIPTPRIIEHCETNGMHSFETVCSKCGTRLNQVVLPLATDIRKLGDHIWDGKNALFIDRISEGIKVAIQKGKEVGAWVYYEPNSCRQYTNFYKNVAQIDIAKFSEDRIPASYIDKLICDLDERAQTKLIIVSQGEKGLKYSVKSENGKFEAWLYLKSKLVKTPVDTSGAGDWLAATFLWYFLKEFPNVKNTLPADKIGEILEKSQEIAARSCLHVGAQGIFKSSDDVAFISDFFDYEVESVLSNDMVNSNACVCQNCLTPLSFT